MGEIIQEEKVEKGGRKKPKKHSTNIDMTPMVDLMCLLITFFMLTTAFSKPKVMEITMPEKNKPEDKQTETKINEKRVVNILLSGDDKIYWYPGMAEKDNLPTLYTTDYSKDGIRKVLLQRNKITFEKVDSLNDAYTRGVLKMEEAYLTYRKTELDKLVEDGKATQAEIDRKYSEIKKLYDANDKDLLKEFLAWKIKDAKKNADKGSPIILIKADEMAKYKNVVDIIDEMAICAIASYAVVDISDVELEMIASAK